jgi:hypothetical protein
MVVARSYAVAFQTAGLAARRLSAMTISLLPDRSSLAPGTRPGLDEWEQPWDGGAHDQRNVYRPDDVRITDPRAGLDCLGAFRECVLLEML